MSWQSDRTSLKNKFSDLKHGKLSFESLALDTFRFQAHYNEIYAKYLEYLHFDQNKVKAVEDIPALPISTFKCHEVKTGIWQSRKIFKSSGTLSQGRSQHHILDLDFYQQHSLSIFEEFFGTLNKCCILGLLPSYLERSDASLVHMVEYFIKKTGHQGSGFFLKNTRQLLNQIQSCEDRNEVSVLFGVSFALMDLAEQGPFEFKNLWVIETGGMKGNRKEIPKSLLIEQLEKAFPQARIWSEYGMTELLSQAYRLDHICFRAPFSLQVLCRQISDPMALESVGKTGILELIDLANIDSCSFILSEDVGKCLGPSSFTVEGRLDHADIRGCHLLLSDV